MLAFFQTVVTSDSVGAGVITQHEHSRLLSKFRHTSVTSMQSEKRREIHERGELQIKDSFEVKLNLLRCRHKTDLVKDVMRLREALLSIIYTELYPLNTVYCISPQWADYMTLLTS